MIFSCLLVLVGSIPLCCTSAEVSRCSESMRPAGRFLRVTAVTTRYRIKPRSDRDSGSSPYDSLESLVSYEVIWCLCVAEEIPLVISPLLAHLPWKRLQIVTDLLLIITSTADELSSGTNIDYLERPWTPKIGVSSEFVAILGCNTHFKTELRRNHSR